MTVVGRVTGAQRFKAEPVLYLIYVRGWGTSMAHDGVWAHVNPNYYPSTPEGVQGELGAEAP